MCQQILILCNSTTSSSDHCLQQHVREATHDCGHTLDLVITSADCTPTSLAVSSLQVSDHLLVAFRIPANKPTVEFKTYTSRQWSKFDMCHFEHDLAASELATTDSTDVDHLFLLYNSTMQSLLDKHAPPTAVRRRVRPQSLWFDAECLQAKRDVRRLESTYHITKTLVCHRIWRSAVVQYNVLLRRKQECYWSSRVREAGGNARELWKTVSHLLVPQTAPPDNFSAQQFSAIFKDKVDAIRSSMVGSSALTSSQSCPTLLHCYSPVTTSVIARLLGQSPNKQCSLDPCPTRLVKSLNNAGHS